MTSSGAASVKPLSPFGWFAAFVAGFLAVFLFFFHFYAGFFAREILAERGLELSQLSVITLNGVWPLSFGFVASVALTLGLFQTPLGRPKRGAIWASTALGIVGVVGTLWGLYSPLIGSTPG